MCGTERFTAENGCIYQYGLILKLEKCLDDIGIVGISKKLLSDNLDYNCHEYSQSVFETPLIIKLFNIHYV